MRLIDRLRDGDYVALAEDEQDFQRHLKRLKSRKLPIVDASNIADYMASNVERFDNMMFKDIFSCALPPFPVCWIESTAAVQGWLIADWPQVGGLISCYDMRARPLEDKIKQVNRFYRDENTRPEAEQVAWIVRAQISALVNTSAMPIAICFAGSAFVFLDEQGGLAGPAVGMHRLKNIETLTTEDSDRSSEHMIDAMLLFAMTAAFMSCQNVQLIENRAPRHERRQREREKKPPFTRYYTLNIEPMKEILRTEGQMEKVGLKKALHICRGGFAYYTPEKPLFGKLTGRFWRPAHVRGSKDVGEIKKDYKIKKPKKKP